MAHVNSRVQKHRDALRMAGLPFSVKPFLICASNQDTLIEWPEHE